MLYLVTKLIEGVMALILEIKVVPQSGKQKFQLDKRGKLKCYLLSAPEKGKANNELIKFIAQLGKFPQYKLEIVRGESSRNKVIQVDIDMTYEDFLQRVGLAHQESLV